MSEVTNLRPLHATHSPHPFQEKANILLEMGYLDEQHNLDSYTQVHGVDLTDKIFTVIQI